jgi:hypothetical protein
MRSLVEEMSKKSHEELVEEMSKKSHEELVEEMSKKSHEGDKSQASSSWLWVSVRIATSLTINLIIKK